MHTPIFALLVLATPAAADGLTADAEVDPTAYVLSGNSIHVGIGHGRWRVDAGNFAMALPSWAHGNDDFDVRFAGFGAKLQLFPFAEQRGVFIGVEAAYVRTDVERRGMDLVAHDDQLSAGVQAGYRLAIHGGFYATAWLGVGRSFGAREVTLAGATYTPPAVNVFPAIHLGYRFR